MILYESSNPKDYSLKDLILSDYLRYKSPSQLQGTLSEKEFRAAIGGGYKLLISTILMALIAKEPGFTYSFWMRLASRKNPFWLFAKWKLRRLSRLYGIQIQGSDNIGPGFYIGHGMGVIINRKTVIGQNCNISQFLSIGSNHGTPATIGDFVYIGPHVSIVEDVHIGNHAKIGAGCVVVKDVPEGATAVGVPNRNILHDA
jgi:serine O-acetyltransferase